MKQKYKTIYFSDYPSHESNKRSVTLAFGEKDKDLYNIVSPLTSQEMRTFLGYNNYQDLLSEAQSEYLSLNTYCLRLLSKKTRSIIKEGSQLYFTKFYLDPIQSTFRGGDNEPLHNWYPFLEGYSPQYVKDIIRNFAPSTKKILDPFSGTGTTVLTAAGLGIQSFYAEINPLLQHLTNIKIKALSLKDGARKKLIDILANVAKNIYDELNNRLKDAQIEIAYRNVFGESKFFDNATFEKILKARKLVDDISCFNPLAADFLSIAILSSLIPVSRLRRAGDLRFKNDEELKRESPTLEESIDRYLKIITCDLSKIPQISVKPILICEDAKNLSLIPDLDITTVVTSPPYLNGTNYFRNTKIELWFLRCLNHSDDLAYFRSKSITAGINDVTIKKKAEDVHPEVQRIVTQLERVAYDERIPRMVKLYFCDVSCAIIGMR